MSVNLRVLFASYAVPNCGAHQYGRNLFSALKSSRKFYFEYADIRSLKDLDRVVGNDFSAVILNYHPTTIPFIQIDMPRRYSPPSIAVMHGLGQQEADSIRQGFFQYYVMGDPTLRSVNPYVFPTGRIIPTYENKKPLPETITIGSFGFANKTKGFERLVNAVQEEFDCAVIRLNIPANGLGDRDGALAKQEVALCRKRLWKSGIRIEATYEFLDNSGLVDFLAANTLNALLYDYVSQDGISSAADHAIAAKRPLAITKSRMFRHLHNLNPPITIEDISLKEIIQNDIRPFEHLLREWTAESICRRYEDILTEVLSRENRVTSTKEGIVMESTKNKLTRIGGRTTSLFSRIIHAVHRRSVKYVLEPLSNAVQSTKVRFGILIDARNRTNIQFNRILDNSARIRHAQAIRRLKNLVPAVFAEKIPRANVQQGFMLDAVEAIAKNIPRILCVGSYKDTASEALKAEGYTIEEIDPAVNQMDLNTFYNLPTTQLGSYDIIFSTSVLEHVKDDEKFVIQMADLLAPGGVAIATCDFKEDYQIGKPIFEGNYRFYTKERLLRIVAKIKDCELLDSPNWDCPSPDFYHGGYKYTFATLAFRKRSSAPSLYRRGLVENA